MVELLSIAKQILELNPNASLTGTLMLKLRGIDLGREPHDIDLIMSDSLDIIFPTGFIVTQIGGSSDGSFNKFKFGDIIVDVMGSNEKPDIIDGLRLGTLEGLMDAKYRYYIQNNESSEKHYNDLVKIGFDFNSSLVRSVVLDDDFELPF